MQISDPRKIPILKQRPVNIDNPLPCVKNLQIGLREQNFLGRFSKIWISIISELVKLRTLTKKHLDDSAIQFPTKSILRHMVFTETIRQHES